MRENERAVVSCAILADRNAPLADRLRQLVSTVADTTFLVADPESLLAGARRLRPCLVIVDLGFSEAGAMPLLQQLASELPDVRVIVLSLYDGPTIAEDAMARGASAVILKRTIGEDLLPAMNAVLAGKSFVSSGFRANHPA